MSLQGWVGMILVSRGGGGGPGGGGGWLVFPQLLLYPIFAVVMLVVVPVQGFTPLPEGAALGVRPQALHSPLNSPRFPDILPISHWDGDDTVPSGADSTRRR